MYYRSNDVVQYMRLRIRLNRSAHRSCTNVRIRAVKRQIRIWSRTRLRFWGQRRTWGRGRSRGDVPHATGATSAFLLAAPKHSKMLPRWCCRIIAQWAASSVYGAIQLHAGVIGQYCAHQMLLVRSPATKVPWLPINSYRALKDLMFACQVLPEVCPKAEPQTRYC